MWSLSRVSKVREEDKKEESKVLQEIQKIETSNNVEGGGDLMTCVLFIGKRRVEKEYQENPPLVKGLLKANWRLHR